MQHENNCVTDTPTVRKDALSCARLIPSLKQDMRTFLFFCYSYTRKTDTLWCGRKGTLEPTCYFPKNPQTGNTNGNCQTATKLLEASMSLTGISNSCWGKQVVYITKVWLSPKCPVFPDLILELTSLNLKKNSKLYIFSASSPSKDERVWHYIKQQFHFVPPSSFLPSFSFLCFPASQNLFPFTHPSFYLSICPSINLP